MEKEFRVYDVFMEREVKAELAPYFFSIRRTSG